MARNPLFKIVQNALRAAYHQIDSGIQSETRIPKALLSIDRRQFLLGTLGVLGVGKNAWGLSNKLATSKNEEKMIVIGGGVAGLTIAYRLQQKGHPCSLYEASGRLGGRIHTKDNFNDQGMFCELGGELIDSGHLEMLALVKELGLAIDDFSETDAGLETLFYAENKLHSSKSLIEAFKPFAKILLKDVSALKVDGELSSPSYKHTLGPKAEVLDKMSLAEYLKNAEKEVDKWVLEIIRLAYVGEYGLEADKQSVINLLILIGMEHKQQFEMFGQSDESKRISGGNQRLIDALASKAEQVPIHLGHNLRRIKDLGNRFELTFATTGQSRTITANRLIITAPFSVLREVEGIFDLNLTPVKKRAIAESTYGTNAKFMMGFTHRFWREKVGAVPANRGSVFGDFASQGFWETSRLQKGTKGIITNFLGGKEGERVDPNIKERALMDLSKIYPDVAKHYDGNHSLMVWGALPYIKGSYSCPAPGHYTSFQGSHGEAELGGRLLFAGEHCSTDFQGYMNGAIASANAVIRTFAKKRAVLNSTQRSSVQV